MSSFKNIFGLYANVQNSVLFSVISAMFLKPSKKYLELFHVVHRTVERLRFFSLTLNRYFVPHIDASVEFLSLFLKKYVTTVPRPGLL